LPAPGRTPPRTQRLVGSAVELDEATISDVQAATAWGEYTARSLTETYLDRIDELNAQGPAINSVIESNPDAMSIAGNLDKNGRPKARVAPGTGFRCL
jgi:amidase